MAVEVNRLQLHYVLDADGNQVSVIVPIDLWREIASERETAYLLNTQIMRKRLMEAKDRNEGIGFEDARAQLGI